MRAGGRARLIAIATVLAGLSASTAGSIWAKSQKVVVGANLQAYVAPKKGACDIRVPEHFSTIQAAVDASDPGGTVCVGPGTYHENVRISHPLRLSGSGATKSIIVGQTTDPAVMTDQDGQVDSFILEGFQVRGVDNNDPNRNDSTVVKIGSFSSGVIVRSNWIVAGFAQLAVRADSGQANELFAHNVLEGQESPELLKISGVQGPSGVVDVLNNTFVGTVDATTANFSGAGTVLDTSATNSSISRNAFDTGGNVSVVVGSAYSVNHVVENNFNADASVKVANYSAGALDASNNWWGDLDPSDEIAGTVGFSPVASEPNAENTACYGHLFAATIAHDLVTGAECALLHSTVDGDVTVRPGTSFGPYDSQITGNVTARNATTVTIGFFVHILGNLRVTGTGDTTGLWRSQVDGDVTLSRNTGALTVDSATVGGDLAISKNTLAPGAYLRFTQVHGNADIRDNTGTSMSVLFNTITQNLNCKNNNPPITADGNTAANATGECA
jgi:hypothetical protein